MLANVVLLSQFLQILLCFLGLASATEPYSLTHYLTISSALQQTYRSALGLGLSNLQKMLLDTTRSSSLKPTPHFFAPPPWTSWFLLCSLPPLSVVLFVVESPWLLHYCIQSENRAGPRPRQLRPRPKAPTTKKICPLQKRPPSHCKRHKIL